MLEIMLSSNVSKTSNNVFHLHDGLVFDPETVSQQKEIETAKLEVSQFQMPRKSTPDNSQIIDYRLCFDLF